MIRPRRHLRGVVAGTIALAAIAAGCASTNTAASDRSIEAVQSPVTTPPTTSAVKTDTCTASLSPQGALPAPLQMPPASYMAAIQSHGALRVGVDQNTLFFGYRDPASGQLEGFDIDVAKLIAQAIFGDPSRIEYVVVSTSQRIPAVVGVPPGKNIKVDMVASLVTMTCARQEGENAVLFSSQYFDAAQGLLIRGSSKDTITGPADLAGKRVCATRGSTSSSNMRRMQPQAQMVEVGNRTECLVRLQDGRVDAITADNTILYGFKRQDRTTVLLSEPLSDEPYGLAINTAHPDFVRFVNAVLQQRREDGTLTALAKYWGGKAGVDFPAIPPAKYQDAP